MWTFSIFYRGFEQTSSHSRWSAALAHAIDAMRERADDVDGLNPSNCECGDWRNTLRRLSLSTPNVAVHCDDPSGNIYAVTRL